MIANETHSQSTPEPRAGRGSPGLVLSLLVALVGALVAALHDGERPAAATVAAAADDDDARVVTIAFFAYVHDGLAWEFRPLRERIAVHPGGSSRR